MAHRDALSGWRVWHPPAAMFFTSGALHGARFATLLIGFVNVVPMLLSTAGAFPHPEVQVAAVSTMGYAGLLAGPPLLGFVAHASSLAGIFYVAARSTVLIAALSISLRASKDSEGCAQA